MTGSDLCDLQGLILSYSSGACSPQLQYASRPAFLFRKMWFLIVHIHTQSFNGKKKNHKIMTEYFSLTGRHTIFGRVCGGIATVNRISMVETDPSDR